MRLRWIKAGALLATGTIVGAALAQQTPNHGDVSGPDHRRTAADASVSQITIPADGDREHLSGASEQIGGADLPLVQLSRPDSQTAPPPQLAPHGRSAEAAQPLSNRGQSKPGGTERLAGRDRCDPTEPPDHAQLCAHAIETRSAEFARPSPTELTPEQRLLIQQRAAERGGADAALRRIARNDVDADDRSSQSVASIVLAPTPPQQPTPAPDVPDGATPDMLQGVMIDSIVQALQR